MKGAAPALYILGPTGVGKSAVALQLAEEIGGEIISVDSMQVYQGMDIGTAKPSRSDRARAPHHLIDVVSLRETFDAAQFVHLAAEAKAAIQSRGRVPIFCGGTGLYLQAFWHGLGQAPPANPELRAEFERKDLATLLEDLRRLDPETYHRVDKANRRRVVRALEVVRLTGRSYSQQRALWERSVDLPGPIVPFGAFGLNCPRDLLTTRLDERVDQMFAAGLVDEVVQLRTKGLKENLTASQALGYRQVLEHLDGQRSLPATISLTKQKTRLYAKRQLTWFRRQAQLTWIELPDLTQARLIARQLAELWRVAAQPSADILAGQQQLFESTHLDSE